MIRVKEILWNVKNYGVGGQLSTGVKVFYIEASACVRVDGGQS